MGTVGAEGIDQPARDWAAANLASLWAVGRRARVASAQLDGALTAGQSSSGDTRIGFSLKYEVKDGLLEEIAELVVTAQKSGATAGAIAGIARTAWDAHNLISNNLRSITAASYGESQVAEKARFALRHLADAIDDLILDLLRSRVEN